MRHDHRNFRDCAFVGPAAPRQCKPRSARGLAPLWVTPQCTACLIPPSPSSTNDRAAKMLQYDHVREERWWRGPRVSHHAVLKELDGSGCGVCVCGWGCERTNTCDACDNATHADITMRQQAGGWDQEWVGARWHATRSPQLPRLRIGGPRSTTPVQTTLCSWAGAPLGNPPMHSLSHTSFVILLQRLRCNDVAIRACAIRTMVAWTKSFTSCVAERTRRVGLRCVCVWVGV